MAFKYLKFHMVNTRSHLTEKSQTVLIPKANTDLHKHTSNVLKANQFKTVILVLYPVMVINVMTIRK